MDFKAGADVAGQKFYYLKNDGALLELALVQYAMDTLVKKGYTPVITPECWMVPSGSHRNHSGCCSSQG